MNPTPRQLEVLAAIQSHWDEHGYGPSYRDIGKVLDITPSSVPQSVRDHLDACAKKGLVTRTKGVFRSTRLTDAGRACLSSEAA